MRVKACALKNILKKILGLVDFRSSGSGGYWLWQVKSMDEAVEWLKRAPFNRETEVEIRPVLEVADFAR
jgi:hypothetical protein